MIKTMEMTDASDASLVAESLTGNRDAFGQIVTRYQTLVCSLAYSATGNLNQVMRGVLFPSSNVLFDVQTQDPGARKAGAKPEAGTTTDDQGQERLELAAFRHVVTVGEAAAKTSETPGRVGRSQRVPANLAWKAIVGGNL